MTDATVDQEEQSPKASKLPLIIGVVLALIGGGGGFFATSKGLILAPKPAEVEEKTVETNASGRFDDISYVSMDQLKISLPRNNSYNHLIFRGELEVVSQYTSDVENVLPRIVDVLNGYLRALETSDIQRADSLARLRSQMLRRVQIVAGPGRINDLLIMEFVLN